MSIFIETIDRLLIDRISIMTEKDYDIGHYDIGHSLGRKKTHGSH